MVMPFALFRQKVRFLSFRPEQHLFSPSKIVQFYPLFPVVFPILPLFSHTPFQCSKLHGLYIIFLITFEYNELFTLSTPFSTLILS